MLVQNITDIDFQFYPSTSAYVGFTVVYMPPNWKTSVAIPYTFLFFKTELNPEQYANLFKIAAKLGLKNPRIFTPRTLELASLFHPSFFQAVNRNTDQQPAQLERFMGELKKLQLTIPVSLSLKVATTHYWLQSVIFLSGVTLGAAIIQNRWSIGTLESKLNRLWQTCFSADSAKIEALQGLQIRDFVLKSATKLTSSPQVALIELKLFYSEVLKKLVTNIPYVEKYMIPTLLTTSQKKRFGFVTALKSVLGKNIKTIILYGSATNSEQFSDYDIILVVRNLPSALEDLAGQSPTYNGLELNISVFDEEDFWAYQLASGDNLMDHALCLFGEIRVPHKSSNDLLARNFSFGYIRFRQQLGMAAHLAQILEVTNDKRNLLDYFIKIPLNVGKGIQGCIGKVYTNEEIKRWANKTIKFDVDQHQLNARNGKEAEALAYSTWATQELLYWYNQELNIYTHSLT